MIVNENAPPIGSIAAKDEFSMAPAGYGLTLDNERWPWGQPPQIVDPEQAMEQAIATLEVKKTKKELLKLLTVGASIEALVEGYIFQQFQNGTFSPDVGLLIKGPLAMYMANMAEETNTPYRFFENEDTLDEGVMDERTFFTMMKDNNPAMFEFISEKINEDVRRGYAPEAPKQENFLSMQDKPEEEEA